MEESPLYEYREENGYSPVVGEGDLQADMMLVGEAPGAQEAKTGRPFVGRAGKVLDGLLQSIGVQREQVYITNVVKDRPPDDRKPTVKEIALYGPFLTRQIDIIQPDVIVSLGRVAMQYLFDRFDLPDSDQNLSQLHGQVYTSQASYGEIRVVPLYHPAAAFYNPAYRDNLEEDIQVLKQFI
ncbi:MAG: uracil-DNA glycosylase [Anaerolineales bacterium]